MTLLEVCDPLLQYVCALNRSARAGVEHDMGEARVRIKTMIFEELPVRAAEDAALAQQYEQMKLPLVFFVDSIIAESRLSFADEWDENRLAYEIKELAGDERFFEMLDEALQDTNERAIQRVATYFTCMGLGFTGIYTGRVEALRPRTRQIAARIRALMDLDDRSPLCPQAYDHTDTRALTRPPGKILAVLGIALVALIATLFVANITHYKITSEKIRRALSKIIAHEHIAPDAPGEDAAVPEHRPAGDKQPLPGGDSGATGKGSESASPPGPDESRTTVQDAKRAKPEAQDSKQ